MWLPRLHPTLLFLLLRAQPPGCAAAGVPLLRDVGNCDLDGYDGISSRTACQAAARELGLDDTVARPFTRPSRPHGCYYKADNVNANRRLCKIVAFPWSSQPGLDPRMIPLLHRARITGGALVCLGLTRNWAFFPLQSSTRTATAPAPTPPGPRSAFPPTPSAVTSTARPSSPGRTL